MRTRGQPLHYASVVDVFDTLLKKLAAAGKRIGGIFAHQSFCDEEIQTDGQVRALLAQHKLALADLRLFWGGQTMHHIDDLGIQLETSTSAGGKTAVRMQNPECLPQFKGEFNKLCIAAMPGGAAAIVPIYRTQTTVECTAWPLIHDSFARHTLAWVPELRNALHARSSCGRVNDSNSSGRVLQLKDVEQAPPRTGVRLDFELAREPWRDHIAAMQVVDIKPFKDSPLWFCAANRVNWDY
eukprot:g1070.t1